MSCSSLPRLLVTSALTLAGFAAIGVPCASAAVQNRISTAVSSANPVEIPNSVHPLAKQGTDLGPAPANTPLVMSIRFSMSTEQQSALDQLLADQQNPASPRYHQWLTPAQYGAQFGLSSGDIAKVTTWLTGQGFAVHNVANSSTFVIFSGTVAQAQTAFSTSIHSLSVKGETHFANVTNAQVPNAIAGVVLAVTGLHDFREKPRVRISTTNPHFTSSQSGNHYVAPGDIYTIYNVTSNGTNLLGSAITGTGETIAVIGRVDIFPADVTAFRSASGLSTTNLPVTIHAFGVDPGNACTLSNQNLCGSQPQQGDLAESSIDVEWSGAMAPAATIDFVNDTNVLPGPTGTDAMTYTVDTNLAPIITDSYGGCEAAQGSTELIATNGLFKQANAQGQTILAAAGDEGAADCDAGPTAIEGENVDFPGSSPYVTSVGGTQFNGDAAATGSGSTWAATQYWAGTSGSDVISSALSYIPEVPWNDETAAGQYGFAGGGGGASAFFTKPTWQVGTGVPVDGSRDVPDISLTASDSHDSLFYCVNVALSDSCTSGFRIASGTLSVAGGTSFDSQILGGLLALIEQKLGSREGNINPVLYALGNSAFYTPGANRSTNGSVVFNDVTTGNNSMPCQSGTPNCGNGGAVGFSATNGYDLASGWGSPNIANLATDWNLVTPLSSGSLGVNTSATTLAATPATVTSGATVSLTATVSGSAGTPTGTVQFFANNVALASVGVQPLVAGSTASATYSWVTSCSNLGQNVITASYSGDGNYLGSKGPALTAGGATQSSNGSFVLNPVEVQVNTSACPDFSLTPSGTGFTVSGSTASVTVAAGGTIPAVTIAAAPVNNFTGTITFSAVVTSSTSGYAPTLTFSSSTVTIPSANQTTTLSLSGITADLKMPAAPGKFDSGPTLAKHQTGRAPWYAGSGVAVASLLLLTLPRRRRLGGLLLAVLAVALIGGATGCGSSSQAGPPSSGGGSSNPDVGTYVITVTGTYTSGSVTTQHAATITYVIN